MPKPKKKKTMGPAACVYRANRAREMAQRRVPREVRRAEYITTATSVLVSSLAGVMEGQGVKLPTFGKIEPALFCMVGLRLGLGSCWTCTARGR